MVKKLTEIGIKYQTDKAYFHYFTEFYNDYFEKYANKQINILEIGIDKGKSLLMLREYFPLATIYAIDINPESINLELGENIHKFLCSQIDFYNINTLFGHLKFDIIIDDGSHLTSHQQKSLGFLFPYLNENGLYVCEDLHTSFNSNYIDSNKTTVDIFEEYQQTQKINCDIIDIEQIQYLNNNIKKIEIYRRDRNALMCYNCKKNNYNDNSNCSLCGTDLSPFDKSITSIILN
jgi:hypothetical protein